jgi:hypothetical protein
MIFSFDRKDCSGQYFKDIDMTFPDAVKYDLYNEADLAGTLITNYNNTFARFRNGQAYRRRNTSFGIPSYEHILSDEAGNHFARITIETPMFKSEVLTLVFYGSPEAYTFTNKNLYKKKDGFDLVVEFKNDHAQPVFVLKNTEKGNLLSFDSYRPMQGTIEINEHLHQDRIFAFLLTIQLYFFTAER